jgi:putative Mn2+ efflux pump MntP
VVLIVFAGVGIWIIKEAFEDEKPKWMMEKVSSFWALSAMGVLGSIDEGAVGVALKNFRVVSILCWRVL